MDLNFFVRGHWQSSADPPDAYLTIADPNCCCRKERAIEKL
jgi:hypothetical protein